LCERQKIRESRIPEDVVYSGASGPVKTDRSRGEVSEIWRLLDV